MNIVAFPPKQRVIDFKHARLEARGWTILSLISAAGVALGIIIIVIADEWPRWFHLMALVTIVVNTRLMWRALGQALAWQWLLRWL